MTDKTKTESVTSVSVENRTGSDAKATVYQGGTQTTADGKTDDEALSKIPEKSKK